MGGKTNRLLAAFAVALAFDLTLGWALGVWPSFVLLFARWLTGH